MAALTRLAIALALRDWISERGLSFCGAVALASMLAPLLVLHGAHNGVIESMRARLMSDPATLVLIPAAGKGAGFDEDFMARLAAAPGARFAIGRSRDVASELQARKKDGGFAAIALEATAPGDPLLQSNGAPMPRSAPERMEIVLSHGSAKSLGAQPGDILEASVGRRLKSGKFTRLNLNFHVMAVLPPLAGARDAGFVDMSTLNAIQDFRDGLDAPLLGAPGEAPPPDKRHFESFRVYAIGLDDVPALESWLEKEGVLARTRSRDIAAIKKIDSALASIIGLIAAAGCAGFLAFMASVARAAARRKWKQMGMLKLVGFSRRAILLYPLTQSSLTGFAGCLLAFLAYALVAFVINSLFAAETNGAPVCAISFGFFCLVFLATQALALLATLGAAIKASAISPARALRDS